MKLLATFTAITFLSIAASVSAAPVLIDFKAMADGQYGYSEKGFSVLDLSLHPAGIDVDIFGKYENAAGVHDAYAYLDSGRAGLGTCKVLTSGAQCNPSNDDNVTGDSDSNNQVADFTEFLLMKFNEAVSISGLWFNNNHDPDRLLTNDHILIGTDNHQFLASEIDASRSGGGGYNTDYKYSTVMNFSAGDELKISWVDEQFYLSAMEIAAVPEPSTLALLGLGLLGFGVSQRQRRKMI